MSQTRVSPSEPASPSGNLPDLDLAGRQLGDYRLLRRLGRGAMADVYLAEQGSLRRQVAFKVLKRELAADDTYVRRFYTEAQAAASLVHANIVQIYEVGCIDGVHYIAQEYVEGQNLAQYIVRHGAPPLNLAVAIMRQVTAALCKAAERGIVHRDIKPENIMLARSGEVKVADFGLARVTTGDDALKLTQVGVTMGTPLYMSPEQVEGRPLDPRSDLYSLGVTCYHMLAGQPPFRGDTALSVALQHVRATPERLENLRPDLPAGLCRLIHRTLAKEPAQRLQSPRDLLKELRALALESGSGEWPAELDGLESVEMAALGHTRLEATQRLATLMRTQALATQRNDWRKYVVAVVLLALLLGAGVAWGVRQPFLLDVPTTAVPAIEKKPSALAQYNYAEILRTEPAWKSVWEYYPGDKKYVPLAKQELAKLYLQQDETGKALPIFAEFAALPDVEQQYRAFGLAGESMVYSLEGNSKLAAEKLADLAALVGGLDPAKVRTQLDPQMVQMLAYVVRRTKQATDQETAAQWETWLNTHFSEDGN